MDGIPFIIKWMVFPSLLNGWYSYHHINGWYSYHHINGWYSYHHINGWYYDGIMMVLWY
jgi:hypothetical protein